MEVPTAANTPRLSLRPEDLSLFISKAPTPLCCILSSSTTAMGRKTDELTCVVSLLPLILLPVSAPSLTRFCQFKSTCFLWGVTGTSCLVTQSLLFSTGSVQVLVADMSSALCFMKALNMETNPSPAPSLTLSFSRITHIMLLSERRVWELFLSSSGALRANPKLHHWCSGSAIPWRCVWQKTARALTKFRFGFLHFKRWLWFLLLLNKFPESKQVHQ